jgi:hypothetical protein
MWQWDQLHLCSKGFNARAAKLVIPTQRKAYAADTHCDPVAGRVNLALASVTQATGSRTAMAYGSFE